MRILVVGGGPAGLYFALLMKKLDRAHEITVLERDGPNDTFGWGIVFSDRTFSYLKENDGASADRIVAACETWDNVDVVHRGATVSIGGNRFSGISRIAFLNILHRACEDAGVDLRFQCYEFSVVFIDRSRELGRAHADEEVRFSLNLLGVGGPLRTAVGP